LSVLWNLPDYSPGYCSDFSKEGPASGIDLQVHWLPQAFMESARRLYGGWRDPWSKPLKFPSTAARMLLSAVSLAWGAPELMAYCLQTGLRKARCAEQPRPCTSPRRRSLCDSTSLRWKGTALRRQIPHAAVLRQDARRPHAPYRNRQPHCPPVLPIDRQRHIALSANRLLLGIQSFTPTILNHHDGRMRSCSRAGKANPRRVRAVGQVTGVRGRKAHTRANKKASRNKNASF